MTFIIAEAGVNHNGSEELAFELVKAAHIAKADAVKFQTFSTNSLVTPTAQLAEYQVDSENDHDSQLSMLLDLELPQESFVRLAEYCRELGIAFISTAFDEASLDFLQGSVGVDTFKISSGDLTNDPFLLRHARLKQNIILSTGMASIAEVEQALMMIAFGLTSDAEARPSKQSVLKAYSSRTARSLLKEKVTLLHCTSEYPAMLSEVNLRVMDSLGAAFGVPVGYSDHTEGITVPIAAAARGARIVEKHFTLDKAMAGPDHKASLSPQELSDMVKAIRAVELSLGEKVKYPSNGELENAKLARRSIVASEEIAVGEEFTEVNISLRRPGTGMAPKKYWSLLGTKATARYLEGDLINEAI